MDEQNNPVTESPLAIHAHAHGLTTFIPTKVLSLGQQRARAEHKAKQIVTRRAKNKVAKQSRRTNRRR